MKERRKQKSGITEKIISFFTAALPKYVEIGTEQDKTIIEEIIPIKVCKKKIVEIYIFLFCSSVSLQKK